MLHITLEAANSQTSFFVLSSARLVLLIQISLLTWQKKQREKRFWVEIVWIQLSMVVGLFIIKMTVVLDCTCGWSHLYIHVNRAHFWFIIYWKNQMNAWKPTSCTLFRCCRSYQEISAIACHSHHVKEVFRLFSCCFYISQRICDIIGLIWIV